MKSRVFWDFILPVALILLVCYFLVPTFHYGVDVHLMKTQGLLNAPIDMPNNRSGNETQKVEKQRTDKCSASKNEDCAVGTYKQCTNNYMEHGKCDCADQRSYELCTKNTLEDPLSIDEVLNTQNKDYGKFATRVNQWNVDDTYFNEPSNLHVQRTNPYVEEL
jgi:hypothetical protein